MDLLSLIIASVLCLSGIFLLGLLIWLVCAPLFKSLAGRKDLQRMRRSSERIEAADRLIAERRFAEAVKLLRGAPVLEIYENLALLEPVRDNHQNILSRCVQISEETGCRAESLAEVEQLFNQRDELQSLYLRAKESFRNLKAKREREGKSTPTWSRSDFDERVNDIKSELIANGKSLQQELEKLFAALESARAEPIFYH